MTDDEQRDGGVLAGLPASRPQRRSRRRGDEGSAPAETGADAATPGAQRSVPAEAATASAKPSAPAVAATTSAKPSSSAKPGTAKGAGTATSARAKATASAKGSAGAKAKTGAARATAPAKERRIAQPGQPAGVPPRGDRPEPPQPEPDAGGVVETAVQAAGELASIGLTAGGQFVRGVLSRLPRP
jgi:hypothetical protein